MYQYVTNKNAKVGLYDFLQISGCAFEKREYLVRISV